MILIVLVFYLVVLALLLLQLCIVALSIGAMISSIRKRPKTFVDFLNGWVQFWGDLWYNIFCKKK